MGSVLTALNERSEQYVFCRDKMEEFLINPQKRIFLLKKRIKKFGSAKSNYYSNKNKKNQKVWEKK